MTLSHDAGKTSGFCYNTGMMKTDAATVARIEWAHLEGVRPRASGSNARLGPHGQTVRLPIVRITDSDGAQGWGTARTNKADAEAFLRRPLTDAFAPETGDITPAFRSLEYPLLDLAGKRAQKPVYALLDTVNPVARTEPACVPCYDTSLYFDDLHLQDDTEAAELIAGFARDGADFGHRAFKIKVGRGARHMEQAAGLRRDIAVIRAVRNAVGPDADLMIDANNGYNLNLTKTVLTETADCKLLWLEEAFYEDDVLYRDLKAWMETEKIATLIADGEGDPSPHLQKWAQNGLVDVLQYDVFGSGFTFWRQLGQKMASWEQAVFAAPHHYGMHLGNYVTGHLIGSVPRLRHVEWDEAQTPGIDGSAYLVAGGHIVLPDAPGWGIGLNEAVWQKAVRENGGVA